MKNANAGLLYAVAKPFVVFVERFYPDPIVFVIVLTFVTFGAALGWTPTTAEAAVSAWGAGLASLMAFTAQLALTLVAGHALARVDLVDRLLTRCASVPRSSRQAYVLVTTVAGFASWLAWPLGLVVGATMARRVAAHATRIGLRVDYPLLVAAAYSGFVIWHMGYSGSAPLFVATPGHAMEIYVGIIPVTQTILSGWNLALAAITLAAVALVIAAMEPPADRIRPFDGDDLKREDEPPSHRPASETGSLGGRLTHSRIGSTALGALFALYLVSWFRSNGLSLNLNVVNWTFVAMGLLLARSPAHYVSLVIDGGRTIGALLIQYPLYAGIMGLMAGSGLVGLLSEAIATHASATTLPLWGFLSAGVVNFFVPSGGGQWAIQGPILLEAATRLGVDSSLVVMSVAYGDQWTNMIQPFWTIPLLAIAGLSVRDVLGYTFVTMIVSGLIFAGGLSIVAIGS